MKNINEEYVITFDEGLFGFEDCKKFVLISFDNSSDAMIALHSLDVEELSFVIMNPFMLKSNYSPNVSLDELKSIGENEDNEYLWYAICVIKSPIDESTVNLKCPIVINSKTKKAKQIILKNTEYKIRHTLKELTQKENSSC